MKVSIVGVGRVGATLAFGLVMRGLATELVLVNRSHQVAEGEALDLTHASAFTDQRMLIRAGRPDEAAGSDVIVLAASKPQPPGAPSRLAMAAENWRLFEELLPPLVAASPEAILLVVTNPVDVMTFQTLRVSGFPPARVIGTGTLIDSARYRALLSAETGIHPEDIRAYILGEHGDTQFPALSVAITGGERIDRSEAVERLFHETVQSGYEIVRRRGYTNYAIALATLMILESIVHNSRRTIPVSTLIDGYEGVREVCLSVPAVIGRGGVLRQLQPRLTADEGEAFRHSARVVRGIIDECLTLPGTDEGIAP